MGWSRNILATRLKKKANEVESSWRTAKKHFRGMGRKGDYLGIFRMTLLLLDVPKEVVLRIPPKKETAFSLWGVEASIVATEPDYFEVLLKGREGIVLLPHVVLYDLALVGGLGASQGGHSVSGGTL